MRLLLDRAHLAADELSICVNHSFPFRPVENENSTRGLLLPRSADYGWVTHVKKSKQLLTTISLAPSLPRK
jgi:hypothetical protein